MDDNSSNKKRGGMGPVRMIILIAAICVFCYSGFRLLTIYQGYKAASDEYSSLADEFTDSLGADAVGGGFEGNPASEGSISAQASPKSEPEGAGPGTADTEGSESKAGSKEKTGSGSSAAREAQSTDTSSTESVADMVIPKIPAREAEEEDYFVEDGKVPLRVDFKKLQAINPDVVGWVCLEGDRSVSYPILRGEDNEMYLHQTFRKQELFAGSIFEDYHNSADFADPNTVVYGHNMKDGSMFGKLKNLNDQVTYDEHPYFWILTPDGNYRYHIFSVFTTGADSDTYTLYSQNGPEFLEWEEEMRNHSNVKNDVPLAKSDKAVILSTCTSDSSMRCVVIGKCVSSARPKRKQAGTVTTAKAE